MLCWTKHFELGQSLSPDTTDFLVLRSSLSQLRQDLVINFESLVEIHVHFKYTVPQLS